MKSLQCKSCGGTMIIDASCMTAVCHYCGSKYVLNHEDTDYYKDFYAQMSRFISGTADDRIRKERAEEFWQNAKEICFECSDGRNIEIRYMYNYSDKYSDVYVARRSIVFHFKYGNNALAERFRHNVSFIDYPSADTKHLSNFFPKVVGGFQLKDDSCILVISKDEDEYPLRLFGTLNIKHVAWIISRMENLCCVLEYNSLVHPEFNLDNIFINPYLHQANLYGNWFAVGKKNSYSLDNSRVLDMRENLIGLRKTAVNLLGFNSIKDFKCNSQSFPKPFVDFIISEPMDNAYDDFALWDDALIQSFGERKFTHFVTDDEDIYGK